MADKVSTLREKFLDRYSGNILDDTYDERDVDWVKNSDGFLRALLASYKCGGEVSNGVELLNDILLFRAKWNINDLTEEDIHPDVHRKKPIFWHGTDKQGHKILHFRVCKQRPGHQITEHKKQLLLLLNKHYVKNPEQQIAMIFDFVDAGIHNMDIDLSKFVTKVLGIHFPSVVAYTLVFKMPPGLEGIWKFIRSLMDPHQSKTNHLVRRSTIGSYVDKDQLLPHQVKDDNEKKK